MKRFFLFFLLSILMLSAFSQERDLDVFKYRFMTDKAFPSQDLNEYYVNLFEFSMSYPKSNKKYGFLLPNGKRLVEEEFDFASNFIDDKANIANDNISGLLFKNGEVKYFPQFKLTYFSSGNLGLAVSNDKYGFINLEGEEIIPFIYDDAFPFYQGFASVKTGNKWQYINSKGEKILPYDMITSYQPLNDSKAVIYDSTKTVQHKLDFILPTLTEYMNKVAKPNYKQQLFDLKSKAFIEMDDFDEIAESSENGLIKVVKAGKVGLVNTYGKVVIPTDYDEIGNLKGKFICAKKGKWGIIDYKNNIIIPFDYEAISPFSEKMALVSKNGKAGYINIKNKFVIKPTFDSYSGSDFIDGIALVKQNGKFGFINKLGNAIIPIIYDNALPFINDKSLVFDKATNKCFFINKQANKILEIEYPYLWEENNGLIKFAK